MFQGVGNDICKVYCSSNAANNRNFAFDAPDFSDCGFFQVGTSLGVAFVANQICPQVCRSGRCLSLSNTTLNGRVTPDLTAGLAALRSMYLSAFLPGGGSVGATGGNSAVASLSQVAGMGKDKKKEYS